MKSSVLFFFFYIYVNILITDSSFQDHLIWRTSYSWLIVLCLINWDEFNY